MALTSAVALAPLLAKSKARVCAAAAWRRRIHGPTLPSDADLYDASPQYPDIPKFRNRDEKEEADLVKKVKEMRTVEEKQVYVNLPKIFGWKTALLQTSYIPPVALDSIQYLTNTTVEEPGRLPSLYDDPALVEEAERESVLLEPIVKNFLAFHLSQEQLAGDVPNDRVMYREPHAMSCGPHAAKVRRSFHLVSGLNRIIMGRLAHLKPHLGAACVDYGPRNEAFWFRGHVDPEWGFVCRKRGRQRVDKLKNLKPREDDPEAQCDHPVQILCHDVHLQLRCAKALEPALGFDDPLVVGGAVPDHGYLPRYVGWPKGRRHGTNLLATWTGTETPFGHLCFADAANAFNRLATERSWREGSDHEERGDVLLGKVVMNGFAAAMGQACNQGFSPFNDPTRPFMSQVGVTDGRCFKMGVYQLNKTAMQGVSEPNHAMRRNVCWHLEERPLFDEVTSSGEVVGFDRDLLTAILKMYLVEPKVAESEVPNEGYLGERRHLYQVKDRFHREGLHQNHRILCSNRPRSVRHERMGEVLAHHKLWMIRHPEVMHTMFLRDRPWFKMKNLCFKGREHWDPEFRWFDNRPGPYLPAKYRGPRGKYRTPPRLPFVSAPLPPDDDE